MDTFDVDVPYTFEEVGTVVAATYERRRTCFKSTSIELHLANHLSLHWQRCAAMLWSSLAEKPLCQTCNTALAALAIEVLDLPFPDSTPGCKKHPGISCIFIKTICKLYLRLRKPAFCTVKLSWREYS